MDEPQNLPSTRRALTPLKVYCLSEEAAQIAANAAMTGLTVSTYLRRVGMGFAPKSILDFKAVQELSKINADQSRLGNLLKMWMADDRRLERFGAEQMTATIQLAMERIGELQTALREQVQKL